MICFRCRCGNWYIWKFQYAFMTENTLIIIKQPNRRLFYCLEPKMSTFACSYERNGLHTSLFTSSELCLENERGSDSKTVLTTNISIQYPENNAMPPFRVFIIRYIFSLSLYSIANYAWEQTESFLCLWGAFLNSRMRIDWIKSKKFLYLLCAVTKSKECL